MKLASKELIANFRCIVSQVNKPIKFGDAEQFN